VIDPAVAEWLRRLTPEYFRSLCALPINEAGVPSRGDEVESPPAMPSPSGVAQVERRLSAQRAASMRGAVLAVTEAGLPGVFAYVYDEFWETADLVRGAVAQFAEVPRGRVSILPDAWAFRIPCGAEHRGWAPHRGSTLPNRTREGHVALVNVWVALSSATKDNSCMYVVPLTRDPHVPASLETLPEEALGEARELAAGDILLWDANVAHWGGRSSAAAREPRISATYTCSTETAIAAVSLAELSFERRLAIIAQQIRVYSEVDSTVTPAITAWADVWLALRSQITC